MNRPEIKRGKPEEGGWKFTAASDFRRFSETDFCFYRNGRQKKIKFLMFLR